MSLLNGTIPEIYRARLNRHILVDHLLLALTAGFAVVALILLARASIGESPRIVVGALIYGLTLLASAVSSLVYNTGYKHLKTSIWRFADHICIFLLIAGTYTPISLLGGQGRISFLLWPVWALALIGSILKLWLKLHYERWFLLLYLAMGWIVLFGLDSLLGSFQPIVSTLILLGGLVFSAGVVFFLLDGRWRWGSPMWHGAVLVGAATHFVAIFAFVIPAG